MLRVLLHVQETNCVHYDSAATLRIRPNLEFPRLKKTRKFKFGHRLFLLHLLGWRMRFFLVPFTCLSLLSFVRGSRSIDLVSSIRHVNGKKSKGNILANLIQQGSADLDVEAIQKNPSLPNLSLEYAYMIDVSTCLKSLESNHEAGISEEEASSRRLICGPNLLPTKPPPSLWIMVKEQFEDGLVRVLLGVACLSAALALTEHNIEALTEPAIIVAILIANAVVGVVHARSAEGSLEALRNMQPQSACTLRGGSWISDRATADLVPGDIILLRTGDCVPADARIISLNTATFTVDESSLTGESLPVAKRSDLLPASTPLAARTNMVYSGTMVTAGSAIAVVTGTGISTEIGQISAGVDEAAAHQMKTPLAEKLDRFSGQLAKIVLVICVVVFLAAIPRLDPTESLMQGIVHHAKSAVALGVAAIPEGLPAVVTLCLSLGTRRMAERNVIVRRLSSVETLGCTSVICTDKTGTLTTNKMVVKTLLTFSRTGPIVQFSADTRSKTNLEQYIRVQSLGGVKSGLSFVERGVSGNSYDPRLGGLQRDLSCKSSEMGGWEDIAAICALCNQAEIEISPTDGTFRVVGEPTEGALRVLVEKLGLGRTSIAANGNIRECSNYWSSQYRRLSVLEFTRERKRMSVLCRNTKDVYKLFVKGAAEMVLAGCSRLKLENGAIIPITPSMRAELQLALTDLATRPLRCIALAYVEGAPLGRLKGCQTEEQARTALQIDGADYSQYEKDMVLVGVCGIKDPPRPSVAKSMRSSASAGIRVMMITGDSKDTAIAIAQEVEIFPPRPSADQADQCIRYDKMLGDSAFNTQDFFRLPAENQLSSLRIGNKVFARAEPRDKQTLISMLEKLGEVTAMTGDGVNDAPALKQADIGIAMGITGTEVAKQAADMVLADDDFASILAAVEEGRNIYANMQAFISFLLSCNMGEIAAVLFASALGLPSPLSPLHLLWVNLVTDGPPATALGFNPADPFAMTRRPRSRAEPLLTRWMLTRYIVIGTYVGLATIFSFIWSLLNQGIVFANLMHLSARSQLAKPFLLRAQSLALLTLILMEMLKALCAVSLHQSILSVPPWRNRVILPCVVVPLALHSALIYCAPLAKLFGLVALTKREWIVALSLAFPILFLEELLKLIGRRLESKKAGESNLQ